ncbi:hypothetical protein [Kitasatospora cinereorecta]
MGRVELLEPVRATWIDEDLAAEEHWEEDAPCLRWGRSLLLGADARVVV